MGLRFDPMGGGQFKQAIKAIVEAERQPIKTLENRKGLEEAKLKLFQDFKSKFTAFDRNLSDFANFKKFRELKVDLGNGGSSVGVTLDKERAEPGSYNLQVEQLAARGSIITNGFKNADATNLGAGYFVVRTSDGDSKELFVGENNSSLRGLAALINAEKSMPVRATVLKDISDEDRPWRLVLSAKDESLEGRVEFPEFYFMDGQEDIYIDNEKDAQNAVLLVDGFPIEAESNTIKDFVQGVNLSLKQARPDETITVTITEDYEKVSGKVKGLVDQVNGILEFINKQNQVDEKSDTRATFAGDSGLQTIEFRLRNLLHEGYPAFDVKTGEPRYVFLNQIGIEFAKNGTLSFNEQKFTKALETDFNGISDAITGEHGFAAQIKEVIGGYTATTGGLLGMREQALRSRIRRIDDDIANKERRLEQKTQALTDQFSRLQGTLSSMQRQGQYLSAALPGGGGGNLVQQLLGG